jgi:hypothetical protein
LNTLSTGLPAHHLKRKASENNASDLAAFLAAFELVGHAA